MVNGEVRKKGWDSWSGEQRRGGTGVKAFHNFSGVFSNTRKNWNILFEAFWNSFPIVERLQSFSDISAGGWGVSSRCPARVWGVIVQQGWGRCQTIASGSDPRHHGQWWYHLLASAECNARNMGKKGSWFSAIKRVFISSSKEKVGNGSEKKNSKEKKKVLGKLRHGDKHSFVPLFREPSSIEKILGEAEREHHDVNFRPLIPVEPPKALPPGATTPVRAAASPRSATPPRAPSPPLATTHPPRAPSPPPAAPPLKAATTLRVPSTPPAAPTPRIPSPPPAASPVKAATTLRIPSTPAAAPTPRIPSPPQAAPPVKADTPPRAASPKLVHHLRTEPSLWNHHACATKIQAVYRGYVARRSYRALRGLVRLQGVMKGQNVKRQTINAMKCMQLLVRIQSQIQSRRIQMLENQALHRQAPYRNDNDQESSFGKWNLNQASELVELEEWDDSVLTKEEIEARMQRKVEAMAKRERAMAYAHSHKLLKGTHRTAQATLMDIRAGGFPWWWNWLERPIPPTPSRKPFDSRSMKNHHWTPTRTTMESKASPLPQSSHCRQPSVGLDNIDTPTPRSSRSSVPSRSRPSQTPPGRSLQQMFMKTRTGVGKSPFKDDESLTSCPPFSVPRYMEPTMSAKAKVKGSSAMPIDESKRRLSFPLAQGIGSFKWSKGSLFGSKEIGPQISLGRNQLSQSIENASVDSTLSMPAAVGRKPFNRFV
ncbi:hypothetical protein Nepgr_010535 [Nepenthes gracilis]|uniref:DUF4005 domain-containing protein n=1 Tax=Nepenthes gracilis TaxID=150966 RepID=A0AAD3SDG5_NEPGR|nr:hypothetical protein Nepgr_010535 [Nepenthes gracilis]